MRLAFLCMHSCPMGQPGIKDTGGMNVYVRELALALAKQGHVIDIFTHSHSLDAHSEIMELAKSVHLIHIQIDTSNELNKLTLSKYIPDIAASVDSYGSSHGDRYDGIYSHYWISGAVGQLIKKNWAVPHVVMFHTLGLVKNALPTGENEPDLRSVTERQIIISADKIVASTQKEKSVMCRFYNAPLRKIAVIPCGVNNDLFYPKNRKIARQRLGLTDEKCILFVGRIEAIKGLENLIKAVARICFDIPRIKLIVCGGDNPYDIEKLRMLAEQLKIGEHVEFKGSVPHEQLAEFYSAADILALPSYYESFGMVALEALACGTPVVASDVGNMAKIIDPGVNGYISPDNTPAQLEVYLKAGLTTDFADRQCIVSSIAGYRWDKIARKIVRMFVSLKSG